MGLTSVPACLWKPHRIGGARQATALLRSADAQLEFPIVGEWQLSFDHGAAPSPPRRVAYFVNEYPSISHTFIRREIRALEASGWEVVRFALRHGHPLVDAADREEAARTHVILPMGPRELGGALLELLRKPRASLRAVAVTFAMARRSDRGLLRSMFALPEALCLSRELRKLGVTHVHAHFQTNSTSVVRIVRVLGGPTFSFTVHAPFTLEPAVSWSIPDKVADAAFVVAISSFARDELRRISPPSAWEKIHLVRCGLDFTQGEVAAGAPPQGESLVCVGRLSPEKGHLILVRAAARLRRRGRQFTVQLLGDGPVRDAVQREIRALGVADAVVIRGWVDGQTVAAELGRSRGLVLPSFAEGLPVVLMEAFRAGRPAVASRVGGIPELVREGISGWLVPPGDEAALADAMDALLSMPNASLEAMSHRCREIVRERHDVSVEARKLAHLLEPVCT